MGIKVEFNSGKSRSYKNALRYDFIKNDTFKDQSGRTYTADSVSLSFPSGKRVHYKRSTIKRVSRM